MSDIYREFQEMQSFVQGMKMGYTKTQIDEIAAKLRAMPDPTLTREHSKAQAISMLSKEIAALQRRGYTLMQIAQFLQEGGVEITTPTLKNYLQRIKVQGVNRAGQKSTSPAVAVKRAQGAEPIPNQASKVASAADIDAGASVRTLNTAEKASRLQSGSFSVPKDSEAI